MSDKTNIDKLIQLSDDAFEDRIRVAATRVETRIMRAEDEGRDLTDRERKLCYDDRSELVALRDADAVREAQSEELARADANKQTLIRQRQIGEAMADAGEARAARQGYDDFKQLVMSRQPGSVLLQRAGVTTAIAGARTDTLASNAKLPYVYMKAGIAFDAATTLTFQSPYFAAHVAQAATGEGTSKPVHADPTLKSVSLAAYATTIVVSDQVSRFGVGIDAIAQRLQQNVIFSVNAATVDAFEAEAGTAVAFAGSAGAMLDKGIALVQSKTGNYPSLASIVHAIRC